MILFLFTQVGCDTWALEGGSARKGTVRLVKKMHAMQSDSNVTQKADSEAVQAGVANWTWREPQHVQESFAKRDASQNLSRCTLTCRWLRVDP